MPTSCAFDWRHGLVVATVTQDADRSVRLTLSQGVDELVVHLSWESLDALTYAGLICPRPLGGDAWTPLAPSGL